MASRGLFGRPVEGFLNTKYHQSQTYSACSLAHVTAQPVFIAAKEAGLKGRFLKGTSKAFEIVPIRLSNTDNEDCNFAVTWCRCKNMQRIIYKFNTKLRNSNHVIHKFRCLKTTMWQWLCNSWFAFVMEALICIELAIHRLHVLRVSTSIQSSGFYMSNPWEFFGHVEYNVCPNSPN